MAMPITNNSEAVTEFTAEETKSNNIVIALLLISAFVVILNETIMGVALPRLMHDLNVTASSAQWLTSAFLLTMAVVIPVTGFLLQRLNTRPIFLLAMSFFAVGTAVCAFAPGFELLLLGRIIQAVGTAIMMPLLMTTVMNLVPKHKLGAVMGNISIVISVAPAIGPTISGIILNYLSWRWMFILVLPIAIIALLMGYLKVKNVSTPRYSPLDVFSVLLSVIGFGALIYGLSSIGEAANGEGSIPAWLPILIGVVGIVIFVLRQLHLQKKNIALLDFRTFNSPIFCVSLGVLSLTTMALFGMIILLPIYMQTVLQIGSLQTGLMMLPGGILMGLMAPVVGRLYDRNGPKNLVIVGATAITAALFALSSFNEFTNHFVVLAAHVVLSLGIALIFTPVFSASLASLPKPLYGHGSAMLSTIQQVFGAMGIALFVSIMSLKVAEGVSSGFEIIPATAAGISSAFFVAGCISIILIILAFFMKKPETVAGAPAPMGH